MAAAAHRRTASGAVAGPAEVLTPRIALDAFLAPPADPGGPARQVRVGSMADLVLLDGPLHAVLADPHAGRVRATIIDGRIVATA
jgi:predicted amidohydrolase YtcJ